MAAVPTDDGVSNSESPLEQVPLPAWLLSHGCRGYAFNAAWRDYTGRSSSNSEEAGWLAVIHPDDAGAIRGAVAELPQNPSPRSVECRILRSDGSWRWNDLRLQAAAGSSSQDFLAVAVDVHERRSEEEHARLLIQAAELLGSTLDPDRIYAHLRELISQSMVCDSLTVSIFDADEQAIRCTYAWLEGETIDASTLPSIPLAPEGKGMQSAVIRSGEPLLVNDFEEAARNSVTVYHVDTGGKIDTSATSSAARTQAAILVPVKLDGKVLGVTRVLSN
jgi:PAS domain S-box-containing protein